jgi:hypothetical protein
MKFIRCATLLFATTMLSAPLLAEQLPDLKSLNDKQLIALYTKVSSESGIDFCNRLSPVISELMKRPGINAPLQQQKTLSDFNCAIDDGKWTTAYRLMADVEELTGNSLGKLGFLVALASEHPENAAKRLTAIAAMKDDDEFLAIEDSQIFQLFSQLWTDKLFSVRAKTANAIMESPHFGKRSSNVHSHMASVIIDEEARLGAFKRSRKLLEKIDSPYSYIEFLALKKYEPIWPEAENRAGPNLSLAIDRQYKKDMALYKKAPEDRKLFQEVAHSLHFAGRFEDVIAHVAAIDHSEAGIAKIAEYEAWALNVEAYALDALGRQAEAEVIFDRIAAIPYDSEKNGWLVNFTINRGSRLVELGQWEKGLEAATLAGTVTEKSGSPYAKMLVRRDKICALTNLGRANEAKPLVEEIFELRKDSYSVAAAGLLCANDTERAAQSIIEALTDPVYAEGVASELQKPEFQLFYTKSKLPSLRDNLLLRPDVKAAYDRVARDIPDAYMPLSGKRRSQMSTAQ